MNKSYKKRKRKNKILIRLSTQAETIKWLKPLSNQQFKAVGKPQNQAQNTTKTKP